VNSAPFNDTLPTPHAGVRCHSLLTRSLAPVSLGIAILVATAMLSCYPGRVPEIEEIAHYDTAGWAHDISLLDDFVYVSDRQGGFLVFDRALGWLSPEVFRLVQDVISLAPNAGRPLLASRFEGLVLLSDLGQVAARFTNGDIANAVVTRGDLAFAAYGSHGLVVARVGKESISIVSQLPTPGWSHDVKVWRNRALLADWNYGLRVVDISREEAPVETGVLPSPATAICIALGAAQDRLLAAVAEGHAGVSLLELDDAGRPSLIARHALGLNPSGIPHPETGGWAHGVAWHGDYLFVANWKRGLAIIDVRDPRRPFLIRELPTGGTSLAVKAVATSDRAILLYLADGEDGLRVFRFRPGPNAAAK